MFKCRKITSLIILSLVIVAVITAAGKATIYSVDEKNDYEEDSEWKTAYYCLIRGKHYGGVTPEWRLGFAFRVEVKTGNCESLELKIDNEFIPISTLRGRWFFGIIDYYGIPRVPATIFGYVIYCEYKE
jgi:hypothetical protein